MANKTDLYKVNLNICDTHRRYFGRMRFSFHLAHGEGQQDALLRLFASCFHACDDLSVSAAVSKCKEPNLYVEGQAGRKKLWISLGTPPLGQLIRASREADQVVVLGVDDAKWQSWWALVENKVTHMQNLTVSAIDEAVLEALIPCLENRVRWHGVLDHESLWLHHDGGMTEIIPRHLKTVRADRRLAV